LDIIFAKIKGIRAFQSFNPMLIQHLCYYGYYENIDASITLFRAGDIGYNWYVCLSGSVDVIIPNENDDVISHTTPSIVNLGPGTAFGESILYDLPRNATVVTAQACELLRVEKKDFKILWAKNIENMHEMITLLSKLAINSDSKRRGYEFDPSLIPTPNNSLSYQAECADDPCRNAALPLLSVKKKTI
jgi:hypothetical protein